MQDPSQKYQKIKKNLKKQSGENGVIEYQDQSDDDGDFNDAINQGEDIDEEGESEADEEIEQIDI